MVNLTEGRIREAPDDEKTKFPALEFSQIFNRCRIFDRSDDDRERRIINAIFRKRIYNRTPGQGGYIYTRVDARPFKIFFFPRPCNGDEFGCNRALIYISCCILAKVEYHNIGDHFWGNEPQLLPKWSEFSSVPLNKRFPAISVGLRHSLQLTVEYPVRSGSEYSQQSKEGGYKQSYYGYLVVFTLAVLVGITLVVVSIYCVSYSINMNWKRSYHPLPMQVIAFLLSFWVAVSSFRRHRLIAYPLLYN